MAAILNFSKTLKKAPAHLHIAAILNFGSISKKSLAHPHVARNVMLIFFEFLRPQENVTPDAGRRTESWRD